MCDMGHNFHTKCEELCTLGYNESKQLYLFIYLFIYQEPTDIPSRKKLMRWVCARGLVCQKREFTVRSSSCEVMIRS